MEQRRLLLALTGGIAAYKIPELVRALTRAGHQVRCAATPEALEFVSPLVLQTLSGEPVRSRLFDAAEEGAIDHIALADWADAVVVAPATANTLARMAAGIADDLVTTLLLATRAPVLVAPAMNVHMWEHPATRQNMATLRARGVHAVGPESGELACGYEGEGRMAEPEQILAASESLFRPRSLVGQRVLVSAGGTREAIDPVRALTNRSSGKMGFAIAAEASTRGADVVLVAGPVALPTPPGVRRIDVESALQMRDALAREFEDAAILVMAAAVADFRPRRREERKIKKEGLGEQDGMLLELVRNPDILAELSARRGSRTVVGFAAESQDVVAAARRKLVRKGCDLLVANDISRQDAGFETDANAVTFVTPTGDTEELPLLPKAQVARRLFDRIEKMRGVTP